VNGTHSTQTLSHMATRPLCFPMPWTTRFQKPIVLKKGRRIATVAEVRDVLLALPKDHLNRPHVRQSSAEAWQAHECRWLAFLWSRGCSDAPWPVPVSHSIVQEVLSTRGKLKLAGSALSVRVMTIDSNPVCFRYFASI
jgi:hypothetical protein